ncbi:MAG: multiheme c-type cytochrome [Deferrisomatales bacterium]
MKWIRARSASLASIALVLCLSFPVAGLSLEHEQEVDYSKLRIDTDGFNAAQRCGECHIDIYALWSNSMHAKAWEDPAFFATYIDERIQGDERIRSYCIQCHAPTLHYNPALSTDSPVVKEGVTCDFCHSVQEVDTDNTSKPFKVQWGKLKRGPYKDSESPVHQTKSAPFFADGTLCGGCHEMLNLKGLPIITTYSEWKEGYRAAGNPASCPDCHMPLAAGFTVSSKFRKTKRRLNLHSFPGGHSRVQLLDALELEVLDETKLYGKMKVKLGLTNVGAGHNIPTGNPLRKVIVDFNVYSALNRRIYNEQVEISRKYADADGNILTSDLDILLEASKVVKDNRIAPGETKEITFEFLAPNERLLVETNVIYVYENDAFPNLRREEKLIHFTKVVNKGPLVKAVEDRQLVRDE